MLLLTRSIGGLIVRRILAIDLVDYGTSIIYVWLKQNMNILCYHMKLHQTTLGSNQGY